MKKKICKLSAAVLLFFSGIMEIGWRFFNMVVCCKRGGRKKERKKWFELSHIRDNHPRNGYAKEYDESRAWCEAQKMQDCYIQSVDGLKLHGFYLPAEHAKRFVILSHGYRGSRFGSLSFMAKYLHEHQCNLLFMEQRCCGESEGKYITFGAKEKWDVQRWAIYVSERNNEKLPIYLYGQSMGAAAVLMASGYRLPSEVKGLIADCGFQSMERQMRDMADNWFHLHYIPLLLKEIVSVPFCGRISYERCRYHRSYEKEYKTCPFLSWREGYLCVPEQFIPELYAVQSTKGTGHCAGSKASVQCLCRSGTVSAYSDGVF